MSLLARATCAGFEAADKSGEAALFHRRARSRTARAGSMMFPSPGSRPGTPFQARLLPKDTVEQFVIDGIKDYVLTQENLEELVRLTNDELSQGAARENERLDMLRAQIAEVGTRLGKLYDALETGDFRSQELAPRIRDLVARREELTQARVDAEEALRSRALDMADPSVVSAYVEDLRGPLGNSSIMEQRSFLKSFVEKVEVDDSEARVYYTVPVPHSASAEETVGVLPFVHHG